MPRKELTMDSLGMNYPFLAFQVLNLVLIISHILLSLIALRRLWQGDFRDSERVRWMLLVVAIPVVGAVGFLWATRSAATAVSRKPWSFEKEGTTAVSKDVKILRSPVVSPPFQHSLLRGRRS
jgi:hypothetical protein